MTTVDDQQRQFQDRIARMSTKSANAAEQRFRPAPIESNTRFMVIMAGVFVLFGILAYVTSLVLQAQAYAAAAAEAEAKSAATPPKLIELDSKAKP